MSDASARILDAAVEAAAIHGLSRLSVADVAKRAGISRPTLYKHFASKDVLVAAAVQREVSAVIEAVRGVVDAAPQLRAALEDGVLAALRLMREHPLLDRVVRTEPEVLVPLLTTDDSLVLAAARPPVEAMIAGKHPQLDVVSTRRLADMLIRLLISYALSAPDDPPEVVAALLAAVIVDGVLALPANAPHPGGRAR